MPFTFKKQIAHLLSLMADASIFLHMTNTSNEANSMHSYLQMASLFWQWSNNLAMHSQQRTCIDTAATFTNRTYFLDIVHISYMPLSVWLTLLLVFFFFIFLARLSHLFQKPSCPQTTHTLLTSGLVKYAHSIACLMPVSYTHLDVYKRQVQSTEIFILYY